MLYRLDISFSWAMLSWFAFCPAISGAISDYLLSDIFSFGVTKASEVCLGGGDLWISSDLLTDSRWELILDISSFTYSLAVWLSIELLLSRMFSSCNLTAEFYGRSLRSTVGPFRRSLSLSSNSGIPELYKWAGLLHSDCWLFFSEALGDSACSERMLFDVAKAWSSSLHVESLRCCCINCSSCC